MISLLFVLLIALMLLRFKLFMVFLLASVLYLSISSSIPLNIVIQRSFSGLDKFPLMAVPMFILAAAIMGQGGMSARIVYLAQAMTRAIPGGLALTVVTACMLFGAVSGSSPATVIAIGAILFPALMKAGYNKSFSSGLLTSAASASAILPPSIGMIIYGTVASVSIGKLFAAAVVPGLLFGFFIMAYAYWYCRREGIGTDGQFNSAELRRTFLEAVWSLGVPAIIFIGIYGGVMTPTESAAVSAVYALAVSAFVYREITWQNLFRIACESGRITAQIMILIAAASALSWLLTVQRIPNDISVWMQQFADSKIMALIIINLILIVAGMFLDPTSVTVIFAPLFLPMVHALGIDPIHFGIIVLINGALGMFTPPFGFNLFVATSVTQSRFIEVSRAVLPFVFVTLVLVLLLSFVPALSLYLPEIMGFK